MGKDHSVYVTRFLDVTKNQMGYAFAPTIDRMWHTIGRMVGYLYAPKLDTLLLTFVVVRSQGLCYAVRRPEEVYALERSQNEIDFVTNAMTVWNYKLPLYPRVLINRV